MAAGTIRYWAAAKEAAGVAEEHHGGSTLGSVLDEARARHADRPQFARVLGRCSFLINGEPAGARDPYSVRVHADSTVEVLPPFAGG